MIMREQTCSVVSHYSAEQEEWRFYEHRFSEQLGHLVAASGNIYFGSIEQIKESEQIDRRKCFDIYFSSGRHMTLVLLEPDAQRLKDWISASPNHNVKNLLETHAEPLAPRRLVFDNPYCVMQTNTNQYLLHLQADFEWFQGQEIRENRNMQQSGLLYGNSVKKELLVWVETHEAGPLPIMHSVNGWSDVTPSLVTGVPVYKVDAYSLNKLHLRNDSSSNKTLYVVLVDDDGEDEDLLEKYAVKPGHTYTYPHPMQLDESGGYAAFHMYDENKNEIGKLFFVT